MWVAHFMLFLGSGLNAWIGMIIVVQNVVSSLVNSHLFDFSQGWLYVFGVGVAGGMALRERNAAPRRSLEAVQRAKPLRGNLGRDAPGLSDEVTPMNARPACSLLRCAGSATCC